MPRKQKSSKSLPEAQPSVDVPVFLAAPESGLSEAQVTERVSAGLDNRPVEPPRKTAGQIVKENVFTYFNMLFFLLALCVIAVGQWLNLTFMGVVFCNTIIGTIQDLRAQRKLDKLKIMAAAEFDVVRDGTLEQVTEAQLVRDDIVLFDPGCQICADAEGLTLRGVQYELTDAPLGSAFPLGVSNHIITPQAEIDVRRGLLLVGWELPPLKNL